jgi:diaminopimelate decarboxylase
VFSGVGKTQAEIRLALTHFILAFNVESESELLRINQVAGEMGQSAPVSLRINPDVDAQTHPHIATGLKQNKFGIPYDEALRLYRRAAALPHVQVNGIDFHIGSQMTSVAPLQDALQKILELVDRLQNENISIAHIDIGGGLGVKYGEETPPVVEAYGQSLLPVLKGRPQKLLLEPGRILVGEAGLLLTRVEYLKQGADRKFAVVDAAMNDLMRPALYDAYHDIVPVRTGNGDAACYDIVGPVCESADCLGRQRMLSIKEGDVLAIMTAGAYGMSMSSNYNTRPMAAEILVEGDRTHIIRQRQTIKELWAAESMVPDP